MNDETFCFVDDVKQNAKTSTGAYHKPAKSGCSLPSDYLTPKQRDALNGAVETLSPAPMDWEAFKALTKEKQQRQVDRWADYYGTGITGISKIVGAQKNTVSLYLSRHGITVPRAEMDWNKNAALLRAIEKQPEEKPKEIEKIDDKPTKEKKNVVSFMANGVFNSDEAVRIFESLQALCSDGKRYGISVTLAEE